MGCVRYNSELRIRTIKCTGGFTFSERYLPKRKCSIFEELKRAPDFILSRCALDTTNLLSWLNRIFDNLISSIVSWINMFSRIPIRSALNVGNGLYRIRKSSVDGKHRKIRECGNWCVAHNGL